MDKEKMGQEGEKAKSPRTDNRNTAVALIAVDWAIDWMMLVSVHDFISSVKHFIELLSKPRL